MSYRAGIILLHDDKVALIERHRAGLHYFSFPGGHVDSGETPAQAAIRETWEELGLQVILINLTAKFNWQGNWQYYYLAKVTGGVFGSGAGEEMHRISLERGTYTPVWMPVAELLYQPVKPATLAEMVVQCSNEGWPNDPVILTEKF
jgi:8-oxo-dGTP diphosphatase